MKKKVNVVYFSVLRRGQVLAESSGVCLKSHTFIVTTRKGRALSIPDIGLLEDLHLGQTEKKANAFSLTLNTPCRGFVVQQGQKRKIEKKDHLKTEFRLQNNDYGSLRFDDIDVLVKVKRRKEHPQKQMHRIAKPGLFSLLADDSKERAGLALGIFCSLFLITCIYIGFSNRSVGKKNDFKSLAEKYTLPFIHEDALSSSPEALKYSLDRRNYPYHTIRYYEEFTKMLLNLPLTNSSIVYSTMSAEHRKNASKNRSRKTGLENDLQTRLVSTGQRARLLILPLVIGTTFEEELIKMIQITAHLQSGFKKTLGMRFAATKRFREDVSYDWTNYDAPAPKSSQAKEDNPLAQIRVFTRMTNEETMYHSAQELGKKAERLRSQLDTLRTRTVWIADLKDLSPQVPIETKHAINGFYAGSFVRGDPLERLGSKSQ